MLRWLMAEEQKELYEVVFACFLVMVFLGLSAFVLLPLSQTAILFYLAKGYLLFWLLLWVTSSLLTGLQRLCRIDIDSHFDAYVFSNLAVSSVLLLGWPAFVALMIDTATLKTALWVTVILYGMGFLSCYVAFVVVSALYQGSLYRVVNLLLALIGFIGFSLWPGGGQLLYGWFFNWFL